MNGFVNHILYTTADIKFPKFATHLRVHPIGEKDINQLILRVYPDTSACIARVSIDGAIRQF